MLRCSSSCWWGCRLSEHPTLSHLLFSGHAVLPAMVQVSQMPPDAALDADAARLQRALAAAQAEVQRHKDAACRLQDQLDSRAAGAAISRVDLERRLQRLEQVGLTFLGSWVSHQGSRV